MSTRERQSLVRSNPKTRMLWYAVMGLLGIGLIIVGFIIVMLLSADTSASAGAGSVFAWIVLGFAVVLQVLLIIGVYLLQSWVRILLWINVLNSLLTFNIFSIIVSIFVALSYHTVLKKAEGPVMPGMTPPPSFPNPLQ